MWRRLATLVCGLCLLANALQARAGGGCFAAGTLVATPDGDRRIEELRTGDLVLAFDPDGRPRTAAVRRVMSRVAAEHLVVRTTGAELHVTADHPFYAGEGRFRAIESFLPGATLHAIDGSGRLHPQRILSIERRTGPLLVFNLEADAPHTYLAAGIAVHNKGGSSDFSSSDSWDSHRDRNYGNGTRGNPIWLLFFVGIGLYSFLFGKPVADSGHGGPSHGDRELDHCFPRSAIAPKAEKTRKLLEFIARTDTAFAPDALVAHIREFFPRMQACWEQRDYSAMQPFLMPDLFDQHSAQLRGMRLTHEINRLEKLTIEAVDLVHVHYTDRMAERSFTALLTVSVRDYYVDDRTGAF